jgi:transcriptional regulator with XRE-family HTH domain
MTQSEVGKRLGFHCTTISNWESGDGYPRPNRYKAVARFIHITSDDLANRIVQERAAKQTKQENDHV